MKSVRVRIMSLLLPACLVLQLAACGSAAPEQEVSVPAPEVPAEVLVYHVYEEKEVTERELAAAVSPLPSDPEEVPAGPVLDRVTFYAYDLNGAAQTKTCTYSPDEFAGLPSDTPDFPALSVAAEGERAEQNVLRSEDGEDVLCVYSFVTDGEGRLLREQREAFADLSTGAALSSPVNDVFEFDAEGRLLLWEREDGFTVSYEYNDAGQLIRRITESAGGTEVMEISRDADGRVLSTVVTQTDGKVFTTGFTYDGEGRILTGETRGGRARSSFELSYGNDGFPENMKIYSNGIRQKTERYSYEEQSDLLTLGKAKVSYNEADIFGGTTYRFSTPALRENGLPEDSDSYSLTVLGTVVRYVKSSVRYGFISIPVRREIAEGEFEPLETDDGFYPLLNGSYGGNAMPQEDGSERLRRVVVSSSLSDVIGNVTDIVLDQHDRPAGKRSAFDLEALKKLETVELDEQGRPIRTEEGGFIAQYSYAGDMLSYRVAGDIPEYTYHSENEYTLAERLPETLLALKDNEVFGNVNYHLEYTGDGLLTKYAYPGIYEYTFAYQYAKDAAGKLSAVLFTGDEIPEGSVFLSFDEHGYLTRYTRILEHEIITFTYSYVKAE